MNLQQLYYFHKLAQMQHYTKAAKSLYITQPSLSKAISALEDALGVKLFEKQGRNVRLTEQGRIFYTHIDIALAEIQKGQDLLEEYKGTLRGRINVAAVPTLLSTFVPEVVSAFPESVNPSVDIHIFQGFSKPILQGVSDGTYDIGFCHVPADHVALQRYKIMSQYLRLAVPLDHPLAMREHVSLTELTNKKILSYRTDNFIGVDTAALVCPYHLNVDFNFEDEVTLASLVSHKKCLALLLDVPDIHYHRTIQLLPIDEASYDFHPIYMVYSDAPKSHIEECFIEYIKSLEL